MVWFLNHYECDQCSHEWEDEWSCACDDSCPACGTRDISPYDYQDRTGVIVAEAGGFVVLHSPPSAEHTPDYVDLGWFPTRAQAESFLVARDALEDDLMLE